MLHPSAHFFDFRRELIQKLRVELECALRTGGGLEIDVRVDLAASERGRNRLAQLVVERA